MNLSLNKEIRTKLEAIVKIPFSAYSISLLVQMLVGMEYLVSHVMLGLMKNARLTSNCSNSQKIKMTKSQR